jgi:hypothetical protein
MHAVTAPGRWVWGLSGVATAAVLAASGALLIAHPGVPENVFFPSFPRDTVRHTVTVPQPVSSLTVDGYGGLVRVRAGSVSHVEVTETIMYDKSAGSPPAVTQTVSGGHLTLADPACAHPGCWVSYDVTTPPDVTATVSSGGGPVLVSGVRGANLNSDGGLTSVQQITGTLTVSSRGGPVLADDVAGTLKIDSDGGTVNASGVTAADAIISTKGGPALVGFAAAPESVTIRSDGGMARLAVPGGPYALTADSAGGPESVGIATSATASRSITITTGGGPLLISSGDSGSLPPDGVTRVGQQLLPPVPPVPPAPPTPAAP